MLVQTARRSLGALIVVAGAIASVPARGADLWQPLFAAGKEKPIGEGMSRKQRSSSSLRLRRPGLSLRRQVKSTT